MKLDKKERGELARKNFTDGYNCSQAVALAFADVVPLDKSTLLRMTSSFGGGMGRLREVCGAVSVMFLITGLVSGYDTPETGDVKLNHYAHIQELAKKFEERKKSIVCRELLGLSEQRQDPKPEERTPEYYHSRPCPDIVALAAEILAEDLSENVSDT